MRVGVAWLSALSMLLPVPARPARVDAQPRQSIVDGRCVEAAIFQTAGPVLLASSHARHRSRFHLASNRGRRGWPNLSSELSRAVAAGSGRNDRRPRVRRAADGR